MKKRLKRIFIIFISLLLLQIPLCVQSMAEEDGTVEEDETAEEDETVDFEGKTLDEIIAEFMEEYGLNEDDFSMGYCYTGTGETWLYNGDKLMVAASLYKLPLNMLYTEMIADGEYSEDDVIGGYTIAEIQYQSMVYSNNELSQLLMNNLGSYEDYRLSLTKYFGVSQDDVSEKYLSGNYFCADYILNTLEYLYDNSENFETIIGYMKQAQPGEYFKLYVDDYEIAHKYGYYEGEINDAAIVYTPTPFLLVAFTDNVAYGENVLGELCSLMCDYTLYTDEVTAEAEAEALKEAEEAPDLTADDGNTADEETAAAAEESETPEVWRIVVIAGIVAGLIIFYIIYKIHKKKSKNKVTQ